jgi:cell division protein FtsW (lipid II flippase)
VGIDKWMFGSTVLLVVAGVLMVFSASAVMAGEKFGSPYYFFFRQLAWAVAGLAATHFMAIPQSAAANRRDFPRLWALYARFRSEYHAGASMDGLGPHICK